MARRILKRPYWFVSQFQTTGDGTLINGGALAAGDNRNFPATDFQNNFTFPVWIVKIHTSLTRQAGGGQVDADFSNVALSIKDTTSTEEMFKNPVPLSVLVDKNTRSWNLKTADKDSSAEWVLRTQGGGAILKATVNPGAVGAPYNMEIAFEGYGEIDTEIPESFAPDKR